MDLQRGLLEKLIILLFLILDAILFILLNILRDNRCVIEYINGSHNNY